LQEAQAAVASAPPETVSTTPEQSTVKIDTPPLQVASDPSVRASEVSPAVQGAVYELARFFAPNWQVTREESAPVGDSLALVLAYWMPDSNIEPKYMALMSFGFSMWSVASARRNPETGEWLPLREVKAEEQNIKQQQPAPTASTLTL
jgi:hypothetical protein